MNDESDDTEVLELVIPETLAGWRVDRALAMVTGRSRAETLRLVEAGLVSVAGKVVSKASTPLEAGQHLEAVVPPLPSGRVDADAMVPVDVVLEDRDFVIVNKRPEQVVHPGAGQMTGTLVAGLLARYPEMSQLVDLGRCEAPRPGVVHRLDKGTSGLLVVARTIEGYDSLSRQAAEHSMERTYWAMAEGHLADDRGVIDAPIGRSLREATMMAVRADGRSARTHYEVVERLERPHAATLVELRLETGRTHQIRVHLAALGHPVVNDQRYGHRRERRLGEGRFFLHSRFLTLAHPRTGERVSASASLPADLLALVAGTAWA